MGNHWTNAVDDRDDILHCCVAAEGKYAPHSNIQFELRNTQQQLMEREIL